MRTKTNFTLTFLSPACALALLIAPLQTFGQALEEITVTAQRRVQNLQDVPISITAFSGETLAQNNITSAHDYLALTPNVSFTEDGQAGSRGLGIAIRGINNLVTGENAFINSIGMYLDEFSIASVPNAVANPHLPDMERVEILRGPQGTLFGRNSLGGTLNLTTKKPNENVEGEIKVGAEKFEGAGEAWNLTGIFNLPISENFMARGVAYYEDSSGFVENICAAGASPAQCPGAAENNFTPNGAPDSGYEAIMLRLNALWRASDRTDVNVGLIYSEDDQGADDNVPAGVLDLDSIDTFGLADANGNSFAIDPGTGFWPDNQNRNSRDLPENTKNKATVGILNVAHQVNDDFQIKWISGFIDAELTRLFDNDLAGGFDAIRRDNFYEGFSWSTELRGEWSKENFDFVVGALYARDKQEQDNKVGVSTSPTATFNGVGVLPPFPTGLGLAQNTKKFEVKSFAVFADLTWHLNDAWDVTVGGRYTDDKILNERNTTFIAPTMGFEQGPFAFFQSFRNFAVMPESNERSFSDFSPRLVVKYLLSDGSNFYGTVSKGYKAGGTSFGNAGPRSFIAPFEEETLWNYELGFKTELADSRVRLNGSVFLLKWKDFQMESFRFLIPGDLSSNFEQTINIPDAEAAGLELELLWAATENLTIGAAFGYLDSEIKSATRAEITGGHIVNLQGLPIPKAPELTANVTGEYRWDVGDNSAWVRLEYIHRDGQFSDIEALTYQQTDGPSPNAGLSRNSIARFGDFPFRTPDFDLLNLRVGYDMANWRLNLYVENLTEEKYYTGTQENFGVSGFRLRPHPRIFGAAVTYKWGE